MSIGRFAESTVEEAALAWLEAAGWNVASGPAIAPDMPAAERSDFGETLLAQRLHDAVCRLNPELPTEAIEDAFRKLARLEGADLVHRMCDPPPGTLIPPILRHGQAARSPVPSDPIRRRACRVAQDPNASRLLFLGPARGVARRDGVD